MSKKHAELHMEKGKVFLLVDGIPYMILGGETCNSSASNLAYMTENVWPQVRALHLNTLLAPVSWELLEPEQGTFDFSLPDGLIRQAEAEGVKLVFLWFGLWKNGASTYVPGWMKEEPDFYFRMRTRYGMPVNAISPLCQAAVERDAAAFAALMEHLQEFDRNRTVIMIQVENEIGLLDDYRDYSAEAERLYACEIPEEAAAFYHTGGTWQQAFGEEAPELFMVYYYAKALEHIASAGRNRYPLPMYTNAWLEQYPCGYPSGGPTARRLDAWKAFAPALDFLAPDIYLPDFESVCREYTEQGNVLFIPEARPSMDSASNVFAAFGQYGALGFSPFAIEDVGKESPAPDKEALQKLSIMEDAFNHYRAGEYLSQSYGLLKGMTGILAKYRCTEQMQGFTQFANEGTMVRFHKYDFKIFYMAAGSESPKGGGLMIELNDDEFLVCGINFRMEPCPKKNDRCDVEIVSITEGHYEENVWIPERRLNGDEFSVRIMERPTVLLCKFGRYAPSCRNRGVSMESE